jgi:predicted nucleic acid-binding OB-fold protein
MHGDTTKRLKIAAEILEERKKGPFKDEEDLRKRVPSMGDGKSKESIKLSEYISFE